MPADRRAIPIRSRSPSSSRSPARTAMTAFTAQPGSQRIDALAAATTPSGSISGWSTRPSNTTATRSSSTGRRATRCSPASRSSCSPTARSTTMTATGWSTTCSTIRTTTMCGTRMPTRIGIITRSAGTKAAIRTHSSRPRLYLAANPDVKAAGVNPLVAFRPVRLEGGPGALARRSIRAQYLADYPDVAAAQDRSARAFPRRSARGEGRQPFAPPRVDHRQRLRLCVLPAAQSRCRGRARRSVPALPDHRLARRAAIRTPCST